MEYKKWDYYKKHFITYQSIRKHVKALSRKKKPQRVSIDVIQARSAIWTLNTTKLYYWILKLYEENLIKKIRIKQIPCENTSHHADSETYQCEISFGVIPYE